MTSSEIFNEMVALMKRERKRVRHAEHLGPREAAESIDRLRYSFEMAMAAHVAGDVDRARAVLREDMEHETDDDG